MDEEKELIEQGEKYMQELWQELGYRVAEEPETYKVLAEFINKKIAQGRKQQKEEDIEKFRNIVNEENKKISDYFFGERCERCNKDITPSIHHYIDAFYKRLVSRLEELKSALTSNHSQQLMSSERRKNENI